jgi:hypothetical protein
MLALLLAVGSSDIGQGENPLDDRPYLAGLGPLAHLIQVLPVGPDDDQPGALTV